MGMAENRVIGVSDATLWTQKDHGDLLHINFAIPHNVARPFSALSDDEARGKNAREVLAVSELTQHFTTKAEHEKWIVEQACRESREIELKHIRSGIGMLEERLLSHLQSRGYAASRGANMWGDNADYFSVSVPVAENPKLVLDLARTLKIEGLLTERTPIEALAEKTEVKVAADESSYRRFIIDLNQSVLKPPSAAKGNIRGA